MSDWGTHREVCQPPEMSGEQVDRLYYILMAGMGVAFACGGAVTWALERMFHFC